jgi:hypothetical protein
MYNMHGCGTTNCGAFNQLSQPYSAYGYLPKAGNIISGQTTPIDVTGSANRIVFTPPKNKKKPEDRWGWFEWQAYDGSSYSTKPGIVALLAPGNVLVHSSFTFDTEAWSIVSNGAGGISTFHSASSRGLLNHYIHSKDDEININPSTGKGARASGQWCVCCCLFVWRVVFVLWPRAWWWWWWWWFGGFINTHFCFLSVCAGTILFPLHWCVFFFKTTQVRTRGCGIFKHRPNFYPVPRPTLPTCWRLAVV